MKKMVRFLVPFCLLLLGFAMSGCGTDNVNVKKTVADATGTVTGKITDASTAAAVQGAEITLFVANSKFVTTSATSTDADLAGKFSFGSVPAGTYTVRIKATGYATQSTTVSVNQTYDNTPFVVSMGSIALAKGYDQKVLVVDNTGAPVSGVTVRVTSSTTANLNTLNFTATDTTAVTAADGTATIAGLSQLYSYTISALPVYDATGKVKFAGNSAASTFNGSNNGQQITITLAPVTRTTTIQRIASNLFTFDIDQTAGISYDNTSYLTSKSSPITLVFNLPVILNPADLTISYSDVLKAGPATATLLFNTKFVTPTPAVALTSDSSVTITPAGALTPLQVYTVAGGISANVGTAIDVVSFTGFSFTVTDTTTAATADPIIDNFNSATGGVVNAGVVGRLATDATIPYLVFSEPVVGTVRLIGTQLANAATETIIAAGAQPTARINALANASTTAIANGVIAYAPYTDTTGATPVANMITSGTSAGNVYRVNLNNLFGVGLVADDATGAVNKIHLYVDVIDTHGNKIQKELTLGVK